MVFHKEVRASSSSSSSNSRLNTKKLKKIPQRGLGVAQLEKLRIEEQKNSLSASSSSSIPFPTNPLPPPPPPPPKQLPSLSPPKPSLPFVIDTMTDLLHRHTTMFSPSPTLDSPSLSNTSNPVDPTEPEAARNCSFRVVPPPYSSSTHNLQRSQHNQQKSLITLVNKTSLPLPTGAVNLQMEPPSNQIHSSSHHIIPYSWPWEERVVGTNPSWPLLIPAFTSSPRRDVLFASSFVKPDEPLLVYANEPGFSASSSGMHQMDWRNSEIRMNKRLRENNSSSMDGSFLSLGTSVAQSSPRENSKFTSVPPSKEDMNHSLSHSEEASQQPMQPSFCNFLPVSPSDTCEAPSKDRRSETLDGVDTNLKLGQF